MKHEPIPTADVLAWLQNTHPALHQTAAVERAWVWLTADLRGDHNKPARESIKQFGFRFAKRGHTLPDGQIAFWAHSCSAPIGFKRKGKAQPKTSGSSQPAQRPDPLAHEQQEDDHSLEELAAVFA